MPNASIEIWQPDEDGDYDLQKHDPKEMDLRGRFFTDADGRYYLRTIRPLGYMIPMDGPVGDMIRAQGRHGFRPAHIHFLIGAPGYREVVTALYIAGDDHIDSDTVFGVTDSLMAEVKENDAASPFEGRAEHPVRLHPGGGKRCALRTRRRRPLADHQENGGKRTLAGPLLCSRGSANPYCYSLRSRSVDPLWHTTFHAAIRRSRFSGAKVRVTLTLNPTELHGVSGPIPDAVLQHYFVSQPGSPGTNDGRELYSCCPVRWRRCRSSTSSRRM